MFTPGPSDIADNSGKGHWTPRMFEKCLHHDGHTRRFAIAEAGGAWEVRTEEDSRLVKRVRYDDWHRVERALMSIRLEVSTLEDKGWVVV